MFSTVLALAMVGGWGASQAVQSASSCPGGVCPTAAPRSSGVSYPAINQGTLIYDGPALMEYEKPRPKRVYGWHPVEHDGLTFEVWGYIEANGRCRWQEKLKENRESWDKAKGAAKAKQATATTADINLTGIDPSKFSTKSDAYTAPSVEAKHFVNGIKSVEADSNKIHVTVIGDEADCAPVIKDLNDPSGAFASMRGQLLVQDYRPKEWQVDPSLGFPANGKPSIIVQTARGPLDPTGGGVIYRAEDYSDGPSHLAEAIRKVNPNYRPENDPGPATGKADGNLVAYLASNPLLIWSALAFVVLMFLPPKRKDS